jgi:hypothetical protein
MADAETLTYILDAIDNVTPVTEKVTAGQNEVAESAANAQAAIDSESISFIKQMTVASGLHRGISQLSNGMQTLGVINDDTAKSLNKVNAAVGMVVGGFQLLKVVQPILEGLRATELGLAAVETFRSVLNNPLAMGLVGAAAGAAIGVGGTLMATNNNSSSTNVIQTIVFGPGSSSDQRSMARASFEAMGGF